MNCPQIFYFLRMCTLTFIFWGSVYNLSAQNDISKENKYKVSLKGGASISGTIFNSNDSTQVMSPFGYNISVAPTLQIRKLSLPFNFTYSDNKYNISYPYFRLGIAPSYKWIKGYLGNNTINFSKYVFAGLNSFGGGIDLNPSIFTLGFFYGRLRQRVFVDSTNAKYHLIKPQFSSYGFAVKAGIKAKSVRIVFTYFSGQDKVNSLPYINSNFNIHNKKNKAIGSEIYIKLTPHISFLSNAGLSILTRSAGAGSLDTLLLNSGEEPLPSWTKIIENKPNVSSSISYAFDNSLRYNSKAVDVALIQKVIRPGYESMGLGYVNNDVKQYTVEPALRLLKNKINASFSFGIQSNNLLKKKITTTKNTIVSANANFNDQKKLLLSISYTNFGLNMNSVPRFQDDSISIQNINQTFSFNGIYFIVKGKKESKSVNLNVSAQSSQEVYTYNAFYNKKFKSVYSNLSYSINKQNKSSFVGGLNYNLSTNFFYQFPDQLFEISSIGIFSTVTKSFLEDGVWLNSISVNLNSSSVDHDKKHLAFGAGFNSSYRLTKKTAASLNFNFTSTKIKNIRLNQQYASIGVTQTF